MERGAVLVIVASLVSTGGCLESLPTEMGGYSLEDIPGIEETSFRDALAVFEMERCQEAHLLAPGNATNIQDKLPPNRSPATRDGDTADLAIVVIRCEQVTVANQTVKNATLVQVSTPIESGDDVPPRDDALLSFSASHDLLTRPLEDEDVTTGLLGQASWKDSDRMRMAEESHIEARGDEASFEATLTSVSVGAELPFGTASSMSRHLWIDTPTKTLTLKPALDVDAIGGTTGTLQPAPSSDLAHLVNETNAPVHGYTASYDALVGLLEA